MRLGSYTCCDDPGVNATCGYAWLLRNWAVVGVGGSAVVPCWLVGTLVEGEVPDASFHPLSYPETESSMVTLHCLAPVSRVPRLILASTRSQPARSGMCELLFSRNYP